MRILIYLTLTIFFILLSGTFIYHKLEGWSWIDSLYFTTVTMATVGYGDMHPTTESTKLFTVFFIIAGVGTMTYTVSTLIEHIAEKEILNMLPKHMKRLKIRQGPRWKFGGRSETAFKIRIFFKDLRDKIEKFRNKHRIRV